MEILGTKLLLEHAPQQQVYSHYPCSQATRGRLSFLTPRGLGTRLNYRHYGMLFRLSMG